ncbi:MAG: ABC transporter permease [Candidatus Aminicenantes bacterium]|nr:ABC transporter permease [Candidatus Aminicenantes bacterium]
MIKNYLKMALRNFKKHKGYSFINIAGLAVGMACCILILLWVQDELSYDRFHENADSICRVIQDINFSDHSTTWAITQGPLGPSLKADFPEIVNFMRVTGRRFRLTFEEKSFDEVLGMADGSIFEMFTFPLFKGDPQTALSDPFSIVLTEEMAEKYFGDRDPIGQTLKADNQYDFIVTGIIKKFPQNSHFRYDFLIPFIFGRELNYTVDNWRNSQFRTYVQIPEGMPYQEVVKKISGYLFKKPTLEKDARLNLQPLTRIHLYSDYEFDDAHGDITYVTIFSLIAFFILLIACINFMNLTTARSANRAREVGIRKVAGAVRGNLLRQFFGESIFMALVALLVAIGLVLLLLPAFNDLAAKELSLWSQGSLQTVLFLLAIAVFTGILAGIYPALFLSGFQPVQVLKGTLYSGGKGSGFRRVLVVFQFSLTILLIVCTLVVSNQLSFMRNHKLGYDKEHLVYGILRGNMRRQFDAVKEELLKNPNIVHVTSSGTIPTYGYNFSNSLWRWEGQNPDEEILMRAAFVDYDYCKTMGIEILEGRTFSREYSTDPTEALIVNEEAVKVMGMESPLGKHLGRVGGKTRIIGVVKNYHFRSLKQNIDPLILILSPRNCWALFACLKSENISQSLEYMEKVWNTFAPGYPFSYSFMDDALDSLYRSEQRIGTIFRYSAVLAVFISCLGLFGLASFMAEQRTKEIGIRKVLGATVPNILLLLSKEFTKWIILANIIAWPVAFYAMNKWLQGYAYRINIAVWSFLSAAVLALLIALFTVSYQTIKAATANPADSLRYE